MLPNELKVSGNIVDVLNSTIYPGTLEIAGDRIINIVINEGTTYSTFIIPGLVDSHIHIESSMMVPSEFARIAVVHGTVATVSDPHEIANVLGIDGVRYMIANGKKVPLKFYFGVPSCVPATGDETSGAVINAQQVEDLFQKDHLKFLSEMMNFPGVLLDDPVVMEKLGVARKYGKPVDGHAPGLRGRELTKYVNAGISTDHEAFLPEEGLEKVKAGMKILIREGTAAKNFEQLHRLINDFSDNCMFCCDDKHPNDLVLGHIDGIVKRALQLGYDKLKVLKCASVNPVLHYGLEVGLLQPGDPADFAIIDNFENFTILKTYINGKIVAENGQCLFAKVKPGVANYFKAKPKQPDDFAVKVREGKLNIIEAADGELITRKIKAEPKTAGGYAVSDPERDILKMAVVNRYRNVPPAVAFIKNFGLKKGAIASSVAHDSHNIVVVGVSDEDIAGAVNLVIRNKGGLAVFSEGIAEILPLPVAGLMSTEDGYLVAAKYERLAQRARELGASLKDPFMTMSFMALLVIPELKLSDRGLFDGNRFKLIGLFEED
jgi:adenine deaminase